jgi:hypothetical protein
LTIADRTMPGGLRFAEPVMVTQESLVRLSPALGSALAAVELSPDGMPQIWGLLEAAPLWQPVIRITGPATVVISADHEVLGMIRGAETHLVKPGPYSLLTMLTGVIDQAASAPSPDRLAKAEHLLKIFAAMQRTSHDATLLVVPARPGPWTESIHLRYPLEERSAELARSRVSDAEDALDDDNDPGGRPSGGRSRSGAFLLPRKSRSQSVLADLSQRLLVQIGHLAAADGAVVLGDDLSLYGFGAEVSVPETELVLSVADAISGAVEHGRPLATLGTGPQTVAARFVQQYPECLALVATHTGAVTLFAWAAQGRALTALTQVQDLLVEF